MKKVFLSTFLMLMALKINAQTEAKKEFLYSNKFSIVAGLIQPIALDGGNIEINYTTKRMILIIPTGLV